MKKFINKKLFLVNSTKNIKTKPRNFTILPSYVGKTVQVHNGKTFTKITILRTMVGHKFGEFVRTRKNFRFKKK